MRILLGFAPLVLIAASGCQLQDEVKQRVRDEAVAQCRTAGAQRAPGGAAGQVDRFCDCLADRLVEGRSLDELRQINTDGQAAAQAGREAAAQCASDLIDQARAAVAG